MDKTQLIFLGLPLLHRSPQSIHSSTAEISAPSISQPQRQAVIAPATLDFLSQKSSGVGFGNTVELLRSCSYKRTAVSVKKMPQTAFLDYPAPAAKRLLAKGVPVAQMGVIGLIMGGEHIFPMIGIEQSPAWYHSLRANRFGAMASTWLLGVL
ncbi:PREDICTED: selT-like protein isoform X2 [Camelina sativa]|uniref:SelT-like protein isoform X2 n=1 Tax=Camelina sativa TaxID=90675 RepID=A0ABM1RMF8_CAMSA|nr:PREDICTED: selT-like protein isoform X2 [Camelina sativa]